MKPPEIVLLEQQIEQLERHSLVLNRGLYTDGLMLYQLRERLKLEMERFYG